MRPAVDPSAVREALHRLFIAAEGTRLRREDEKKSEEVASLLNALGARLPSRREVTLVDAAAGRSSVGLLAVELLGVRRLVVIERDPARAAACRDAAGRLSRAADVDVRRADVADPGAWPERPDLVAALHACGAASDAVVDGAARAGARWLFLVPCCYADAVPFAAAARRIVEGLGVPDVAALRRPLVQSLVDAERTLRLGALGYEAAVAPFVAPTVTPHNLLWQARRVGEPVATRAAREAWEALRARGDVSLGLGP